MVGRIVLGTLSSFGILYRSISYAVYVFFFCEFSFLSHHGSLENFFVFPTFLLDALQRFVQSQQMLKMLKITLPLVKSVGPKKQILDLLYCIKTLAWQYLLVD